MQKLSIAKAAQYFGITKEAIYNRIRRNTLQTISENGIKLVIIGADTPAALPKKAPNLSPKFEPKNGDKFTNYLLCEIDELKKDNKALLGKINELHLQKEQILTKTSEEIKQIHHDKDEKLRYFLTMLQRPLLAKQNGEYLAPIDIEFDDMAVLENTNGQKWVKFSKYCKMKKLGKKKQKKLKEFLTKNLTNSKFTKVIDGNIYVNGDKKIKELYEKI